MKQFFAKTLLIILIIAAVLCIVFLFYVLGIKALLVLLPGVTISLIMGWCAANIE